MAHLTTNPADKERFMCIYPAYINSKKTIAEGRRIAAEKVCVSAGGLTVGSYNKMYPREWNRDVQFRGRVRIQLKLEDGSLCQEKFASRKDVMFYVAEMIPKLKSRTQKSGGAEAGAQQGEGGKKAKKKKK
uniref:Signal recognition particle 19 kDa protein n=1 Tax=Cyprinus carpio TaxID=7962 RepID=A0A8C1UYZ4_CYPCA